MEDTASEVNLSEETGSSKTADPWTSSRTSAPDKTVSRPTNVGVITLGALLLVLMFGMVGLFLASRGSVGSEKRTFDESMYHTQPDYEDIPELGRRRQTRMIVHKKPLSRDDVTGHKMATSSMATAETEGVTSKTRRRRNKKPPTTTVSVQHTSSATSSSRKPATPLHPGPSTPSRTVSTMLHTSAMPSWLTTIYRTVSSMRSIRTTTQPNVTVAISFPGHSVEPWGTGTAGRRVQETAIVTTPPIRTTRTTTLFKPIVTRGLPSTVQAFVTKVPSNESSGIPSASTGDTAPGGQHEGMLHTSEHLNRASAVSQAMTPSKPAVTSSTTMLSEKKPTDSSRAATATEVIALSKAAIGGEVQSTLQTSNLTAAAPGNTPTTWRGALVSIKANPLSKGTVPSDVLSASRTSTATVKQELASTRPGSRSATIKGKTLSKITVDSDGSSTVEPPTNVVSSEPPATALGGKPRSREAAPYRDAIVAGVNGTTGTVTTSTPRNLARPLLCTLGAHADTTEKIPPDGLCDLLFYTHALLLKGRHFSTKAFAIFLKAARTSKVTLYGVSVDISHAVRTSNELESPDGEEVFHSLWNNNVRQHGILNAAGEDSDFDYFLEKEFNLLQDFKELQLKFKRVTLQDHLPSFVALGVKMTNYNSRKEREKFPDKLREIVRTLPIDILVVVTHQSTWDIAEDYATSGASIWQNVNDVNEPSLSATIPLLKSAALPQNLMVMLSFTMAVSSFTMPERWNRTQYVAFRNWRPLSFSEVDYSKTCAPNLEIGRMQPKQLFWVTGSRGDHYQIIYDTKDTMVRKLNYTLQSYPRPRLGWALFDLEREDYDNSCKDTTGQGFYRVRAVREFLHHRLNV